MYKILDNTEFDMVLWRAKDYMGECYQGAFLIRIEASQHFIPTVIHELLHEIDHDMPEEKVLAKEKELMAQLSHKQLLKILEKAVIAIKRTYKKKK